MSFDIEGGLEIDAQHLPIASLKSEPSQLQGPMAIRGLPEPVQTDPGEILTKLRGVFEDKGFSLKAGLHLAQLGILGPLFCHLVIRTESARLHSGANYWFSQALDSQTQVVETGAQYLGTMGENRVIDSSIAISLIKGDLRRELARPGVTPIFRTGVVDGRPLERLAGSVPVVVVGAGPAGIMATRGMIELGFNPENITVIDRSGDYKGIWRQQNVVNGTKNNPSAFDFEEINLEAAPGPAKTVADFLDDIVKGARFARPLPTPIKGAVLEVKPGDLNHTVWYQTAEGVKQISSPIVIMTPGAGKPLAPSREGYMTTDTPEQAGVRWQKILSKEDAEKYRGKSLIFIGLGNSAAEMVTQIQEFNKQGYGINYLILTHYPKEAVDNPTQTIRNGKEFRVFRDLKNGDLVRWEGDLAYAGKAYYEALSEQRIVAGVSSWHLEGKSMTIVKQDGSSFTFDCDQLFTLIGYGHDKDELKKMSLTKSDGLGDAIAYDYDGELQRCSHCLGRDRVYPGYFGLGPILKNSKNPSAAVMPAIMHRMYDLLFGVSVRATEFTLQQSRP